MTGWDDAAPEEKSLAPYASASNRSRGRRHNEQEHPFRTVYMRDRDRVIHSSAFRRLEYKTQVFVYHEGDYYRTRLTHTIEVAQIARTMARALGLNEDLTEAIALSHDLGHPPFGHAGEGALNRLMMDDGGFEHNAQALRVVDHVESRYPEFRGLNLTWETREAIAKHSKQKDHPSFEEFSRFAHPSLEAQVVDLADSIAYNAHDLDDGITAELLVMEKLEDAPLWSRFYRKERENGLKSKYLKYQVIRHIINAQVTDALERTRKNIERFGITTADGARSALGLVVDFSHDMKVEHTALKKYLRVNMYQHYRVIRMEEKATRVVEDLFTVYDKRVELMPPAVVEKIATEGRKRIICDYIAGMTDKFALEEHRKLFDPMARV